MGVFWGVGGSANVPICLCHQFLKLTGAGPEHGTKWGLSKPELEASRFSGTSLLTDGRVTEGGCRVVQEGSS